MSLFDVARESSRLATLGWGMMLAIASGIAAAALTFVLRAVRTGSAPRFRRRFVAILFVLSLGLSAAVAVGPVYGLNSLLIPRIDGNGRLDGAAPGRIPPVPFSAQVHGEDFSTIYQTPVIVNLLDGSVRVLAVVWLVAVVVSVVRLLGGLLLVRAMKRHARPVAAEWPSTELMALSSRLAVTAPVQLLESSDIDVPVTAGWRRPRILLPSGMATTLSAADLKLVLAHELVHIRRADYFWSLVQSFCDALTVLSPGHRWLSEEGRRLCEDACDDEVVALGVNRMRYAMTLEALAHWSRGRSIPAPVCAASRNLETRVRRLLTERSDAPSRRSLAGAGLLFCTALVGGGLSANASAWRQIGTGSHDQAPAKPMLPFMFEPEATGVPFRIVDVEPSEEFAVEYITVTSVYPKRIVSLQVGADVSPRGKTLADDVLFEMLGVRSTAIATKIEPGRSVRLAIRFITADESAEFRRASGIPELQMRLYPTVAAFEDGSSWVGAPLPAPPLTIPRALVSSLAPKPASGRSDIWTCYDAEAHQTSEGGLAPIREDPQRVVRCTNGRWVEIPVQ